MLVSLLVFLLSCLSLNFVVMENSRHDKVMERIMRIFKIWGDRNVYSEEFLTDLRGLLTAKKATPATPQSKQAEAPQTTTVSTTEFNVSTMFFRSKKN